MTTKGTGMFIYDEEITIRRPDYEQVIADLDADPKTQKDKATWPKGARWRASVEAYFKLRDEQSSQ